MSRNEWDDYSAGFKGIAGGYFARGAQDGNRDDIDAALRYMNAAQSMEAHGQRMAGGNGSTAATGNGGGGRLVAGGLAAGAVILLVVSFWHLVALAAVGYLAGAALQHRGLWRHPVGVGGVIGGSIATAAAFSYGTPALLTTAALVGTCAGTGALLGASRQSRGTAWALPSRGRRHAGIIPIPPRDAVLHGQLAAAPQAQADPCLAAALPDRYRKAIEAGECRPPTGTDVPNADRYTVPLPDGITADDFKARLFAGALGEPENRIRRVPGRHPGELVIDVLHCAPEDLPKAPYPLAAGAVRDPFAPTPFGTVVGTDEPYTMNLMDRERGGGHLGVFTGTGGGKSFTARLCVIPDILAPETRVIVIDLKPSVAWYSIEGALDEYVTTPGEAQKVMARMRAVVDERNRSRLTHNPITFVMDETADMKGNKAFWADAEYVAQKGRTANIRFVLASQSATLDASGIPPGLRQNLTSMWMGPGATTDLATAVGMAMSQDELNQLNAPGIAWVKDRSGGGKKLISTYLVTTEDAQRITAAAPTAREFDQATAGDDEDQDDAEGHQGEDERDPAELAAEDLLAEIGDRASLTLDEAREVIGDDALATLRDALPRGNNGMDDKVSRRGNKVPGIRRERLEGFLDG